ncbi:pyridoxal phosphate-dependent transferase, partial [Blyttiomyces helicus]
MTIDTVTPKDSNGQDQDIYTRALFGSSVARQAIPRFEMPEVGCFAGRDVEMATAYRFIKDELALDGNPVLNLASFVTTYMEDEVEKLMMENMSKNFIDQEEYPMTAELQSRCVNMIARLFNAPPMPAGQNAVGVSTVGSSEAIILSTLAMKRRWQLKRKAEGKPYDRPNLVMGANVQVCWEKAVRYLDVEARYTWCDEDHLFMTPERAIDLIDENTIGVVSILGSTMTGHYENASRMNELLLELRETKGLDVPMHIDAASGGFVAPFVAPDLVWDFRLETVVSINVSGHKYGLVYAGIGWGVWRSPDYLPDDLVFHMNYLGADQASFTLNFSKGASQVIAQ